MKKIQKKKKNLCILLFAGTTEGRLLAEYFSTLSVECYVCTATEYGSCILPKQGIQVLPGRMNEEEIAHFIEEKGIHLVVDATHPFALVVTKNISHACYAKNCIYVRCMREVAVYDREGNDAQVVFVDSVKDAVTFLQKTEGKILIATGSKELRCYTELTDYRKRCYARVLSTKEAVLESIALGFEGAHLIAMQGPFSQKMNEAILIQTGAAYFVTKESGKAGGFEEKVAASKKTNTTLIVVNRPKESGKSMEEVKQTVLELIDRGL